jgi:hypothetical protein
VIVSVRPRRERVNGMPVAAVSRYSKGPAIFWRQLMWYASIRRLLCVAALASFAVPAFADPPARVGRIAYLDAVLYRTGLQAAAQLTVTAKFA